MAFTRKFLLDNGVPEDKVDEIMAERGRTLADYIPKGDVQTQIDAALDDERKKSPPPATESQEYKELLDKYNMQTALSSDDFSAVKSKFRETVYKMLDHGEKRKPYTEQLKPVAEKYEEYFTPKTVEPPKTPQFGAPTQGQLPGGDDKPKFNDSWGFGKKT